MNQTEMGVLTREDWQLLEKEIKELESKISAHYTKQAQLYGEGNMTASPEVLQWNKELRRLRRLRG